MSDDKNKNNPKRPAVLGDVFRIVNDLSGNVEKALNNFQTDLVSWQRKVTAAWNTLSVVVQALKDKGILTDEDLSESGKKLWEMNQRNMAKVKEAASRKQKVDQADLEVDPVTSLTSAINRKIDEKTPGGVESNGHEDQTTEKP